MSALCLYTTARTMHWQQMNDDVRVAVERRGWCSCFSIESRPCKQVPGPLPCPLCLGNPGLLVDLALLCLPLSLKCG